METDITVKNLICTSSRETKLQRHTSNQWLWLSIRSWGKPLRGTRNTAGNNSPLVSVSSWPLWRQDRGSTVARGDGWGGCGRRGGWRTRGRGRRGWSNSIPIATPSHCSAGLGLGSWNGKKEKSNSNKRCPISGVKIHARSSSWGKKKCTYKRGLISGVSLLERCPNFRGVLIREVSSFQECPY